MVDPKKNNADEALQDRLDQLNNKDPREKDPKQHKKIEEDLQKRLDQLNDKDPREPAVIMKELETRFEKLKQETAHINAAAYPSEIPAFNQKSDIERLEQGNFDFKDEKDEDDFILRATTYFNQLEESLKEDSDEEELLDNREEGLSKVHPTRRPISAILNSADKLESDTEQCKNILEVKRQEILNQYYNGDTAQARSGNKNSEPKKQLHQTNQAIHFFSELKEKVKSFVNSIVNFLGLSHVTKVEKNSSKLSSNEIEGNLTKTQKNLSQSSKDLQFINLEIKTCHAKMAKLLRPKEGGPNPLTTPSIKRDFLIFKHELTSLTQTKNRITKMQAIEGNVEKVLTTVQNLQKLSNKK